MDSDQNDKENLIDMAFFEKEAARLRKEFDLKTQEILDRIRDRRLKEIKEKIQS